MRQTVFGLVLAGICGAFYMGAAAQESRSASDGVYTAEQASRGQVIYIEQCASCHGDNLEGMGPMPPLAGGDFLTYWGDKSVGELLEKTHETMPATSPGTLTIEQAADVTAFMLQASAYPAGTVAMEAKLDLLKQIKIGAPKH